MGSGRQSVMMDGVIRMQELCVDNWGLPKIQEVSYCLTHDSDSYTYSDYPCIAGFNNE